MYAHVYIYMYIHVCLYIYIHAHTNAHTNTQTDVTNDSLQAMEWHRLPGSIKLQVLFAKKPYKRDAILQKRLTTLSILLTVATPFTKRHRAPIAYVQVT